MDSLSSVNSGITNAVKDFFGLSISSIWMASNGYFSVETIIFTCLILLSSLNFIVICPILSSISSISYGTNKLLILVMKILIFYIFTQTTSSFINLFPVLLIPAAIIGVQMLL
jgi:hypothetical protein